MFYKTILEYITWISAPTVIINGYSIDSRKTDNACGNSMHLCIEFIFENQASLNKRDEHFSFDKIKDVAGTQYEATRYAFTLQFLKADPCSFFLQASFLGVCPV